MKQIYACKLYKSSTRKQTIKSALANPVNQPLVKQLREYLDDEYIHKDILEPSTEEESETNDGTVDNIDIDSEGGNSGIDDTVEVSTTESTDDLEGDTEEDDPPIDSKGDVKSSVTASLNSIAVIDIDSLKGLVNSVSDTFGVTRIRADFDKLELWLYYSDDTNLNDVMTPVIELLEASNYYYLTFNRLARSANAIVFEIDSNIGIDTSSCIESTGGDNE